MSLQTTSRSRTTPSQTRSALMFATASAAWASSSGSEAHAAMLARKLTLQAAFATNNKQVGAGVLPHVLLQVCPNIGSSRVYSTATFLPPLPLAFPGIWKHPMKKFVPLALASSDKVQDTADTNEPRAQHTWHARVLNEERRQRACFAVRSSRETLSLQVEHESV